MTIFASLLSSTSVWAQAARESGHDPRLDQIADFELVRLFYDGDEGVTRSFSFSAFSKLFRFGVRQVSPFLPGAETVWIAEDGNRFSEPESDWVYWSGHLYQGQDSTVQLRTRGAEVEGLILENDQIYLLEPASEHFPRSGAGDVAVFRLMDLGALWDHYGCGVGPGDWVEPAVRASSSKDDQTFIFADQSESLREVELRLLLDSYFFQRHGAAAADRAQGLVHQLNGLFEREMGVTFRISETMVSMSPAQDLLSRSTDARGLLDELGRVRAPAGADMAHLFTGRELDGGTLGISWMGAACDTVHGVSLTQDLPTPPARFVALAHELAHVLGARHDGIGYCAGVPRGQIMWPVLETSAVSFSDCSQELVSLHLPRFSCVSALTPEPLPAPETAKVAGIKPVRLQWKAVVGAEAYQVEVFDEVTLETIYSDTIPSTEVAPQAQFHTGRRYRWRVAAMDAAGLGQRSPWKSFTVSHWVVR